MVGPDMKQYLSVFLDEAEEQLRFMDQNLPRLAKHPEDPDLLQSIFRAARSLKGGAASMGLEKLTRLAHAVERALDELRWGRVEATRRVIDLLLGCLDAFWQLKESAAGGGEGPVDIEGLIEDLRSLGERPPEIIPPVSTEPAGNELCLNDVEMRLVEAAQGKGLRVWRLVVTLDHGCCMKAARAYIVYRKLEEIGEIIKAVPPAEDIEAGRFDRTFSLVLITAKDAGVAAGIVKSTSEIAAVRVEPVWPESRIQTSVVTGGSALGRAESKQAPRRIGDVRAGRTVRVDVGRLDKLLSLVGELVIDRSRLAELEGALQRHLSSQTVREALEEVSVHIGRIIGQLQQEIVETRMLPVGQVFSRFPRMVRDLAQNAGKEIDLIIEGRETRLERTVIEEIGDPLAHLLHNAIDHGIESREERVLLGKPPRGTVAVRAYQQESRILITVTDDGRGLDTGAIRRRALALGLVGAEEAAAMSERETLDLIFRPGFSMATRTNDTIGWGAGMNIVRSRLEKIGGIIEVTAQPGRGTTFTVKLPLTLSVNRSLLVKVGDVLLAFPLADVVEIIEVPRGQIQHVRRQEVALFRGEVLPLFFLATLLGIPGSPESGAGNLTIVITAISEKRFGFIVDTLVGEQEIVVKSLGDYIGNIPGLIGATIVGDGNVALILDVRGLLGPAVGGGQRLVAG